MIAMVSSRMKIASADVATSNVVAPIKSVLQSRHCFFTV